MTELETFEGILNCWGVRIQNDGLGKKLIGPGGKSLKAKWNLAAIGEVKEAHGLGTEDAQLVLMSTVLYEVARALIAAEPSTETGPE